MYRENTVFPLLFFVRRVLAKRIRIVLTALAITTATTAVAQTNIQARKADEFVDSMGINVHMESTTPPYNDYDSINLTLQSLGMRHFRDEINRADPSFKDWSFVTEINRIGKLGYSLCGLIEGGNDYPLPDTTLEAGKVVPMIKKLLPTIEAVEGPNEPDDPTKPPFEYGLDFLHYPQGAINESENLWSIVKGDSKISDLPILAMSEGNAEDFEELAQLVNRNEIAPPRDYTNFGNMHAYQGGGVGDNGLENYIHLSHDWTRNQPLWTTEMGYHNNTSYLSDGEQQGVSQRASAIYLPIAFLSGFNKGVVRTFSYELIDEDSDPPPDCSGESNCSGEGYYGLLNYDFTPKPAYTALQNLIELLQDPGSNFEPGSLAITFSGAPRTMRHTLLQKSNGDYYLALWNNVSVYKIAACTAGQPQTCTNILPGKDLYPRNEAVTVTFSTPQTFTVYAPNDPSGVNPTGAYTVSTTSDSIQLELPPEVLLIKIVHQ
jgi:hypothetical protein